MTPFVVWTICAVAVLLVGESMNWRPAAWIAKPVASAAFVTAAIVRGAFDSDYGRMLLVAFVLSWLGDVLLIPKQKRTPFVLGLLAFLSAHLFYAAAFIYMGVRGIPFDVTMVALTLLAVVILRWLSEYLRGGMRFAVSVYVVAIIIMAATSVGASANSGRWLIAAGGMSFLLSDLAVARDRFVEKAFLNRLWGLPLYYAAQLMLVATIGGVTSR